MPGKLLTQQCWLQTAVLLVIIGIIMRSSVKDRSVYFVYKAFLSIPFVLIPTILSRYVLFLAYFYPVFDLLQFSFNKRKVVYQGISSSVDRRCFDGMYRLIIQQVSSRDTAPESPIRLSTYPKNHSTETTTVAFKTGVYYLSFRINSIAAFATVEHARSSF